MLGNYYYLMIMLKKFAKYSVIASIVLLIQLYSSFAHVAAESVPFYWDAINVRIALQPNGDLLIEETQIYTFQDKYSNQRYRYIPLDKIESISDVRVQENDLVIPSKTGIQDGKFWISWEHPLTPPEKHTFVLKYRVSGALQLSDKNTQIYWKAIFPDRKAPIKSAIINVKLPAALAGKVLSFKSMGVGAVDRAGAGISPLR